MSLPIAIQSVVFYVVSCTPYYNFRAHQRSKAQAKKERAEKTRIQGQYPEMYQHPDPFNTNPYWSEEIMIGPHIETRKYQSAAKNESQKRLASAGKDVNSVAGSSIHIGSAHIGSTPTVVPEHETLSLSTSYSDDWNRKRYQREDEELWGHDISRAQRLMDAIKQAGSSAGRRIEASLGMEPREITEEDRREFYFAPKNPPVNDHHPPIVRQKPLHQDGHKWMLQPPPPAKVMEGKVPVSRTTSVASHLSRKTTSSDSPALSRRMHERVVEAKLKSGELPTDKDLVASRLSPTNGSRRSAALSSYTMRSRSFSIESSEISEGLVVPTRNRTRRSKRTRPVATPNGESSDDADFFDLKPSDQLTANTKIARRPKLETVASSESCEIPKSSFQQVETGTSDTTTSMVAKLSEIANLPASQTAETLVEAAPEHNIQTKTATAVVSA
ncbi:hypothetical protein Micbo1qcDRAFT_57828 [Microdochium bolleyi]|uniref:Signal peptide-containing protein n=1 Tax=Microdochium bolleyi TaxID=196109 RepID=A0A136J3U9_9PEZI|nr:hypothetical protein Micbo1qcDRAFT_57828 [Microdochium bolleyi]